jgi:beta-carotene 15,15'-dioxygenase
MIRRLPASPETWLFLVLGGGLTLAGLGAGASISSGHGVMVVLALAVTIAGLPHGALDPWVAWQAGLWRTGAGLLAFHLVYLGLAGLVVAVWWLVPGASLAAFLLISAWHFAGDWRDAVHGWTRALVGLALLALPAWRWAAEVEATFTLLAGAQGAMLAWTFSTIAPLLALGMAAVAGSLMQRSRTSAIELAALVALAQLLPPIAYFVVYFCALHSLRHLRQAAQKAEAGSRRKMAVVAVFYTAVTVALVALAWPWLAAGGSAATPTADLARVVFIGLAALTLPHMLVVAHAERSSGQTP